MSPIDENELRDELRFAEPASSPRPDALGAAVVARGRAVRRRRTALASVATVAVVALAGVGVWNVLPRDGQHAVPSTQTPTPSASPVDTPLPSVTSTPTTAPTPPTPAAPPPGSTPTWAYPGGPHKGVVPSDFGTALQDRTLPRERETGVKEYGPFEPMALPINCANGVEVELTTLQMLEASRMRSRVMAGDSSEMDGALLFPTDSDARAFITELGHVLATCDPVGPANSHSDMDPVDRTRIATSVLTGAGDEAIAVRYWTERQLDPSRWVEAPGGTLELWARSGRLVAYHSLSGEFVGDPLREGDPGSRDHQVLVELLDALG